MSERLQPTPELAGNPEWSQLIEHALTVPGSLGNTYNRFYSYSFMNQILLYIQGVREPVATYKRWQELGRQVQKGSKAKQIMRPIFYKDTDKDGNEQQRLSGFKYVRCLFTLSETTGEELPPYTPPSWHPDRALQELNIQEVPFSIMDGNTMGYSQGREVSVSPIAKYPLKTMVHEMAHVVLGHTAPERHDEYATHRGICEFQAEATALLVLKELDAMEHMNESESRAYIQGWMINTEPDPKAIRQVFGCVETILKAGRIEHE